MLIELSDQVIYSESAEEHVADNLQTRAERIAYYKFCLELDADMQQQRDLRYEQQGRAMLQKIEALLEENTKAARKVAGAGKVLAQRAWRKYKTADAVWSAVQKVRETMIEFHWWEDFEKEHERLKAAKG